MLSESEIVAKLERWAEKKYESGQRLGYPRESAFRKLTPSGIDVCLDDGIDMEFQQIEEAYRTLPGIPKLIIERKYLSTSKNDVITARYLGIHVRTFYGYLRNAHTLIANFLNIRLTHGAEKEYKTANCR